jgi:hypothetical protein
MFGSAKKAERIPIRRQKMGEDKGSERLQESRQTIPASKRSNKNKGEDAIFPEKLPDPEIWGKEDQHSQGGGKEQKSKND